jgi:hypothetical protein
LAGEQASKRLRALQKDLEEIKPNLKIYNKPNIALIIDLNQTPRGCGLVLCRTPALAFPGSRYPGSIHEPDYR